MELDVIRETDKEVAELIEKELKRQQTTIELIASENFTSKAVMAACGSVLTNKYAEGKPHKRFYGVFFKLGYFADWSVITRSWTLLNSSAMSYISTVFCI